MKQLTLAATGFERYAKTTRRATFLAEMERVVPWPALWGVIEPFYPKAGNGRPPVGVERMLRIYFLQQWFNLSDPAAEEALYDSRAMRDFVGIDLGREPVPDETTVCRFRHLLEQHDLGRQLFDEVQRHLEAKGLKVATGTIVDATIINAPSSTKNAAKARDPEMHQTKKGNQWYFGMKAHIGVDSRTKLIHAAVATPANVADSTVLPDLLHGNDTDLLKFLDASVSFYLGHGSTAGASYGADEAGAQATAQSERTKPVLVANRFHAISQASMMSARLRNTELASQWLRR